MTDHPSCKVVALAGGVGGAKLAYGLYQLLPPGDLTVVVNTADDLELFGLRVCPDLDTVMYTLAGVAGRDLGWGVENDTFGCLEMLGRYGKETWFKIGDRDLATHLLRTELLSRGASLTECTRELASALKLHAAILPMCDEPVRTRVRTAAGELEFQEYFVRRGAQDTVLGLEYAGIDLARPTPAIREALDRAELIVLCPSNPLLSIEPILRVAEMRGLLSSSAAPRVAVSPIVGGRALRGPAAQLLADLGHEATAPGVAAFYWSLLDGFVLDQADAELEDDVHGLGLETVVTNTVMIRDVDRIRLAARVLALGDEIREGRR